MYEENNRFSWTNLFIKIIIVIIFILFTVWLLSLSTKSITKGMSDSLGVLTDNIFAQNVDKMKEVGKSYFTTERLPEKVGEIKTLTLAKMYDENLILELKDKNGNVCSAKNSYVKVEKMETEYQMRVYLECGDESDFIKVIMGCYNYCNTDICEKKDASSLKNLEYEYSKTTGGNWTDYGSWSEWSKEKIESNNYRQVETKVVKETYTYNKTVGNTVLKGDATCPAATDGFTFVSSNNGVCTYQKTIATTTELECPSIYNGSELTGRNGSTCNYSKTTTVKANPNSCPATKDDYALVSQNGFTCNYSKNVTPTAEPTCASTKDGYTYTSRSGFTCNYSKTITETANKEAHTSGGGSHQNCYSVAVGTKIVSACKGCAKQVQTVYDTVCETVSEPTTTTYSCPSGFTESGSICVRTTTGTTTGSASCPSGYTKSGNTCAAKTTTVTTTSTVGCPSGYTKSGNTCVKSTTITTTATATCPSGTEKRGDYCVSENTSTSTRNMVCPSDQKMVSGKCYSETTSVVKVTDTRNVTYYRYRVREFKGGSVDYKWSRSDNDASLLNAGYKLTGKTREYGGK